MPQPATPFRCARLTGTHPPTLDALEQAGPVSYLKADLETLALVGTQLAEALISTRNSAALISGRGGFAPYQDSARRFHASQNRVTFRVHPTTPVHMTMSAGRAGPEAVVSVSNAQGDIGMRIEAGDGYDACVLGALDRGEKRALDPSSEESFGGNVISLGAVRSVKTHWSNSDAGQHLNEILDTTGRARASVLPYVGKGCAWRVQPQVLSSFVTFVTDRAIRHTRLVPGCGFVQGDVFKSGQVQLQDDILLVSGSGAHFALDLAQIATAWVTRFGGVSHLELFDHNDCAVAVLAPDPNSDVRVWNDLLASLPMARPAV